MSVSGTKRKRGRPKIQIDSEQFENLCRMQCTEEEIAAWFHCSLDTINNWCKKTYDKTFADVAAEYKACGKISLRRAQMKLAQSNAAMAIFLGKNILGQSDDPRKYEKEETQEDKLDKLMSAIEAAVGTGGDTD